MESTLFDCSRSIINTKHSLRCETRTELQESTSIDAAISFVNAAAAKLDAFLADGYINDDSRDVDNHSIDSELRRLRDNEDALRKELEAAGIFSDEMDSGSIDSELRRLAGSEDALRKELEAIASNITPFQESQLKCEDLKLQSDVPDLMVSSPSSSVCTSSFDDAFPTVLEVEVHPKEQKQIVPEEFLLKLREYQYSVESPQKQDKVLAQNKARSFQGGLQQLLAGILYGRTEYKVQPVFSRDGESSYVRTRQGGVCVALATVVGILRLQLCSENFLCALAFIPALVALLEIHLPHRMKESDIAFLILLAQFAVKQIMN